MIQKEGLCVLHAGEAASASNYFTYILKTIHIDFKIHANIA